jgi:hypothetical protein
VKRLTIYRAENMARELLNSAQVITLDRNLLILNGGDLDELMLGAHIYDAKI